MKKNLDIIRAWKDNAYRLVEPATLISRGCGIGLLAVLLACASLLAQAQTIPARQALGPEVTIVADRSSVRFATLEGTPVTRLKVYTQAGEPIFDSGAVTSPSLEWPLQDQQRQPVATGRYVYHLTSKDQAGASWIQDGHLIVSRASDTNSDGVGIVGDSPLRGDVPVISQSVIRRSEVRASIQAGDEELGFGTGRASDSKLAAASSAASLVTYKITIQTGTKDGAGTDANVGIVLVSSGGSATPSWSLDNPNRNDFERGSVDVFYITSPDLSALAWIQLAHDNTGNRPGWYISWVTVQNTYTGQLWYFPACRWVASNYYCPIPNRVVLYPNQYPDCASC